MPKLFFDISMSLDGFVAGPNQTVEQPLGERGDELHEWVVRLASWREAHGLEGGDTGPDDEVVKETVDRAGAFLMGRSMFSSGAGPWADDPKADGWWGDDPPFGGPLFILTHHAREPVEKQGGTTYTFVTEGIESALEQARAAAGDHDVQICGGAEVIQQYLNAGSVDEFQVHVVPIFLGDGVRLFGDLAGQPPQLELTKVVASPSVTHLSYRVAQS
jgi:dihydrofolate reductase